MGPEQHQNQEQSTPQSTPQQPRVIAPQGSTQLSISPQARIQPVGASSSMTLLDNLTSQLTPERKERFIELFKQLQSDSVSANQFLAQSKLLLDQQQYQQLENLKNKPSQLPSSRPVSIQPQSSQQSLDYNTLKRTMSGTPLRDDTQRVMSNHTHIKRPDIPVQHQPTMYRSNTALPIDPIGISSDVEIKQEIDSGKFTVMQDFMNHDILKNIVTKISHSLNTSHVNPDVVSVIALATQERIQGLIREMIDASKYRVDSQSFTQPMPDDSGRYPYKIADILDVKKQLLAVERVEREEERRRREFISERERRANMAEDEKEGDDDKPKKKKKKDQGGVGARYMSDDVRNKSTNETALMIAGGVKKSWMLTGLSGPSKEAFPAAKPPLSPVPATPPETSPSGAQSPTIYQNPAPSPMSPTQESDDQPRGRGRPKRRKSGSGQDIGLNKKSKGFNRDGLFLPPSTIGRPHHRFFGEQGTRKITVRDALFVLEDENERKRVYAPRTLLKSYTCYLK